MTSETGYKKELRKGHGRRIESLLNWPLTSFNHYLLEIKCHYMGICLSQKKKKKAKQLFSERDTQTQSIEMFMFGLFKKNTLAKNVWATTVQGERRYTTKNSERADQVQLSMFDQLESNNNFSACLPSLCLLAAALPMSLGTSNIPLKPYEVVGRHPIAITALDYTVLPSRASLFPSSSDKCFQERKATMKSELEVGCQISR